MMTELSCRGMICDVSYSPGAVRRGRTVSTFEVPFVPAIADEGLCAPAQPQNVSASVDENVQGRAQSQSQTRPANADADSQAPPQSRHRKRSWMQNLFRKNSTHE